MGTAHHSTQNPGGFYPGVYETDFPDIMKIAGYGIFGTLAVVVDSEVKNVGKIPRKKKSRSGFGNKPSEPNLGSVMK